ncbi:PadR-like family transcriptional regulator [Mycobacteroides abscessus subsp. bolletii]|uniref:PadR family transcriptional regulator n=1 Tax=Mycobacteroides abscessus TaxID=36809 RepID=UPI0009A6AED7|nr:PadR family transcriptional regulator [Mycobacteroides abscessus]SKG69621.1 PadR-like family transcriptional regulator [Mycobacteroides abscessus subsp. bolletii]SKH12639.1 PadR-like family transcriptional regulator [Mycobacteroides abscessus subsp. bolletii]
MSLRYALLALLTARPLSAYDIAKQFSTSVGFIWYAPDSQIYPELRRMEEEGLVAATEVPSGGRRTKREYRVTDEGVSRFRGWVNDPVPYQRERDVHHLRAAYLEWADVSEARKVMERHIEFHQAELHQWSELRATLLDRTNSTLSARLAGSPPEQHDRIVAFKVFAYDGLIERARTEIAWAVRGLKLIEKMAGEPTSATSPRSG